MGSEMCIRDRCNGSSSTSPLCVCNGLLSTSVREAEAAAHAAAAHEAATQEANELVLLVITGLLVLLVVSDCLHIGHLTLISGRGEN